MTFLPVIAVSAALAQSVSPAGTDFSGAWTFDRAASSRPGPDGRIVIAPILGDAFTATQDDRALTLNITAGALKVTAVYRFTGESRNLSPDASGTEVPVISEVSWNGNRLVIRSRSSMQVDGRETTVETTRALWLEDGGQALIIERTGSPSSAVTPSRSVYRVRDGALAAHGRVSSNATSSAPTSVTR